MQANLERVGAPQFSEDDQTFARKLQAFLKVETSGLRDTVGHLADKPLPAGGGSSDVAEVSYIAPTVEFSVTTAAEHILDAELLRRAKEAHAATIGGVPYKSPIPEGQAVPLPKKGGS